MIMAQEQNTPPRQSILRKIFHPHESIVEAGARRQAELSAALSMGAGILYLLGALGSYLGSGFIINRVFGLLAVGIICLAAYGFSRSKYFRYGISLLVGIIVISAFFFIVTGTRNNATTLFGSITIALILGSSLLPLWGFGVLALFSVLITLTLTFFEPTFSLLDALISASFFLVFTALLYITTIMRDIVERQRTKETNDSNAALQLLQNTLEQSVKERTQQIRTAAEVAHTITSTLSKQEVFNQTVNLIVDRFGYYHSGIYLLDDVGASIILIAAAGRAASELIDQSPSLTVDESSIIGWVASNRSVYISADTENDERYLKTDLLPETKSEAGIPIKAGEYLLGVLDVQSKRPNAFDEDAIITLQILAQQTAAAIQNWNLSDASQIDLQSISETYRYGYLIAQAIKEDDVLLATRRAIEATSYQAIFLLSAEDKFRIASHTFAENLPEFIDIHPTSLDERLTTGPLSGTLTELTTIPNDLLLILKHVKFSNVVFFPVRRGGKLKSVLIIGSEKNQLIPPSVVQPFASVAELAISAIDRISSEQNLANQIKELESITITSQALSASSDLDSLFSILHNHVQKYLGNISFLIALYEANTNSISIPYMYENIGSGEKASIESFPLGEGLTSILIRTKEPLMIVEDTERRAVALGARVTGKPAKSWLGTPLIVSNDVIGAIVVQDTEKENAFNENDLRFMTTLSAQVAGAINNIRLVEETRKRALQLRTASEIARDISGSLDINELLAKATLLIRDRFNFYHAAIFMKDTSGEYVVVREATGDAGNQMKRTGHKLKIGSKSIVGFVTGSGEHLVVNDTNRDATYYANPLLPETRAEAAIPLKVGQRILGALDVQSNIAYAFTSEDINVLRILADQLAIAIINSELFAETQEHLSQHRLLHHVTTAAASGTTLEEALNSAAQGLQVTLGGDRVAILFSDQNRKALKIEAVAGYSEDVKNIEIPFGEGITGWVAQHQQPLRINDVAQDSRYIEVGSNVCSELAIPLTYRGELLGVLNVESDQPDAYSDNDEELLGTLGGSLAAIIANARLLEQIRNQVDRERLLYEVTSKIRRSTDLQSIMSTTASELSKALGAKRAQIKLDVNPDTAIPPEQENE